jgi:nickel-dependent lactate racemase
MDKQVSIHYGKQKLSLRLKPEAMKYELFPAGISPVKNVRDEVVRALTNPIQSDELKRIVRKGHRVVLLADDITRLTPTREIIPVVLDELNAGGIPDSDITLVIALGTHRPMTKEEIIGKYGEAVTGRIKIINHNYLDKDQLKHYGITRRGTDIWANRFVVEADVRIGIGNILPHYPTGWSGGAKILLPGVAGEKTTGQVHLLGATEQHLGHADTPCREEMEDFAKLTGLEFIINTVLDREGKLVRAVAGNYVAAHREGVKWGMKVYGVPYGEKTDITLSSSFPVDNDLFQSSKGIFSAMNSTKKGGEIILLSPCYEGVSPTHGETVELAHLSDEELFAKGRDPENRHDMLSITAALYFNTVKKGFRVTLVTDGIPDEIVRKLGFYPLNLSTLQSYLDNRLKDNLTIGLMHNSAEIVPLD